jgi:hypothetical protein
MEKPLNDNLGQSMIKVDEDAMDIGLEELKKILAERESKK